MERGVNLYDHYHRKRQAERLSLFRVLREHYGDMRCLYPGCFVHITPSFVFPSVTYVDSDARAASFFSNPAVRRMVAHQKEYAEQPDTCFLHADFTEDLDIRNDFGLLISQFAGFVSDACNRYLRTDGILLANDSHGDASLAAVSPKWTLVGVVLQNAELYSISANSLQEYFVPKRGTYVDRSLILGTRRAIPYVRTASNYIFRKSI